MNADENLILYCLDENFFRIRNASTKLRALYRYLELENLVERTVVLCVKSYSSKKLCTTSAENEESVLRTIYVDTTKSTSVSLQIKEQTFYPSVLFFITVPGVPYLRDMNVDALVVVSNERMRSTFGNASLGETLAEFIAAFRLQFFGIERRTSAPQNQEEEIDYEPVAEEEEDGLRFDVNSCGFTVEERTDIRSSAFTAVVQDEE